MPSHTEARVEQLISNQNILIMKYRSNLTSLCLKNLLLLSKSNYSLRQNLSKLNWHQSLTLLI